MFSYEWMDSMNGNCKVKVQNDRGTITVDIERLQSMIADLRYGLNNGVVDEEDEAILCALEDFADVE